MVCYTDLWCYGSTLGTLVSTQTIPGNDASYFIWLAYPLAANLDKKQTYKIDLVLVKSYENAFVPLALALPDRRCG